MSEAVIVALISGAVTLAGTILTILATSRKTEESFKVHQAVTDEKIENLTREVQKHNGFAEKIPVIEEKIKVANNRIADLEKHVK
jgi:hypothetical protein